MTIGIGTVSKTAKVEVASRAIVFGNGGIDLNVLEGVRLAGADQIVGVDLDDSKGDMGTQFGITDFVNPSNGDGDMMAHLVQSTGRGADYTFDATGNVNAMRAALELSNKGWGQTIIIGVAPVGAEIST